MLFYTHLPLCDPSHFSVPVCTLLCTPMHLFLYTPLCPPCPLLCLPVPFCAHLCPCRHLCVSLCYSMPPLCCSVPLYASQPLSLYIPIHTLSTPFVPLHLSMSPVHPSVPSTIPLYHSIPFHPCMPSLHFFGSPFAPSVPPLHPSMPPPCHSLLPSKFLIR